MKLRSMLSIPSVGLAGLMLLVPTSSTWAQDNADPGPAVYNATAPGTVLIRAAGIKADDTMTSEVGTGFIVSNKGHVLTASHVIPNGDEYKFLIIGGTFGPTTAVGKAYKLELVGRS